MDHNRNKRNRIGITMGDPCGIGPEVILKALTSQRVGDEVDFIVIGSERVLSRVAENLGLKVKIYSLRLDRGFSNMVRGATAGINVLDLDNISDWDLSSRKALSESGRASVEYIQKGINLAMDRGIDALVTAPVNKEAIKLPGFEFTGHTELLKEMTSTEKVVMMMVGGKLRVAFVTTHLAIKDIPSFINQESIFSTVKITAMGLKRFFHLERPRIAVCGLNPHCSDGGRFGSEESEFIIPAIKQAQETGIDCSGPLSADMVFNRAINGDFDVVVVHYHDQGAIPIKLCAFDSGVNITLGIPFIRTSPTHGTAYDIVGKGVANPGSMIEAIKTATMMVKESVIFN
ncbi:MAG: 4-hydroxythreonine-4-phosphate dehydrogenase PdxA [Candidatus Scalindua sp. AMX11]|nr:MAG: 4-hydroxythreonine-4-phosphate dehydrogenase PdxA [Candidatus Scalindua sp.]NOG83915.1 4-hydroxythreonine-4-phosphate dehydrogenase PdxA [Planctomycetota bacterium]RZV87987.1 MAG: 4-hydroxythreonine-4-phosphate dehydrogenase PdxA [Candidatus Scalindua sp. SCAELEC01]TDE64136.1 MAG: 4-hydroxythreonine-4-phosphate dehydrogenase PdxA [Candidatus Scalindua sp. AMX11]GJQ58437.1 MAG: 4-hydroxythreonine-4-phosphate dehydrogenase [Candidatus Scalindua sp.]